MTDEKTPENAKKPTLSLAKPVKLQPHAKKRKPKPAFLKDPKKQKAQSPDPKQRQKKAGAMGKGAPPAGKNKPLALAHAPRLPDNRKAAYEVAAMVMLYDHYLDKALAENERLAKLFASDRQFVRLLVTSMLRHHQQLSDLLDDYVTRRPPADAMLILMMGAAQLLLLKTPSHAAISTTVDLMRAADFDHMTGLANAILRKLTSKNIDLLAPQGLAKNIAPDILKGWHNAYGPERVMAFLPSLFEVPQIDLNFAKPEKAAELLPKLKGDMLTKTVMRAPLGGNVTEWPGFAEGAWWVQDVAASVPADLLGDISGKTVIDMCAAPGGKTAQLIAKDANVTALEIDPKRANRLETNLKRLRMSCGIAVADALDYTPSGPVDAVLLDAPCSATGTIKKRPDVMRKNITDDIKTLPDLQMRLAKQALSWLKPDGQLIYATCSMQQEEGEAIIAKLTTGPSAVARISPITKDEAGLFATSLNKDGTLRLLPDSCRKEGGNDGFFIARLHPIKA
ncbi:MAG: RsmB/NOP family class I SAM-dependent RNA methyltransferase [Candidatus Puniceispirillaceae bacterium]